MGAEALRIQSRIQQVGGRLDQAAENDKALTAVGIVLFWPALFFLGGTKQQEAEFARLKGEYDALHQAAVHKRCDGIMTAAPVAPAAPVASETTRTATPESSFPR